MVRGLETFSRHFENHQNCYVVIGGVACERHFEEQGLAFRVTKDVDIILIVEAIDATFIKSFWEFVKRGAYEHRQVSEGDRRYYRFIKPQQEDYPMQLELFSRKPDLIPDSPGMTITPIPADEDLSSLSAILMDEAYYQFTVASAVTIEGASMAASEALICLKAKAYLDLWGRKEAGEQVDTKNIAKHKNDVFRLAATLRGDISITLPEVIKQDLQQFVSVMEAEKHDLKAMFKAMGIFPVEAQELLNQLKQVFVLD
jgi:hypothetical protein